MGEDIDVPQRPRLTRAAATTTATVEERRAKIEDLIGDRPLTARSVLASALLGADEPRLPVAQLIDAASLFGISAGATRTCLSRMVSDGELAGANGTYTLAGDLLERRHRVDDAAHPEHSTAAQWDGTWEIAVVSLDRRRATDRLELRKATQRLHLAEVREGVWVRPDNLDRRRLPSARAVLDRQCVQFRGATSDITAETARSLFSLGSWSHDAARLMEAMNDELDVAPSKREDIMAMLTHQFALSISVVRHLQRDPLLPAALLPPGWPAVELRMTYRRFDAAFKRRMNGAFRHNS